MLTFNKPSFEEVASKEWIVTNGLGGYASSTISGANTRRYHGILVASLRPPTERTVLVSKIDESIIDAEGHTIPLSANQYPGAVHPLGHTHITAFERDPFPKITFTGEGFALAKTICMAHLSNTTVVVYENLGDKDIHLVLNPFYVLRDYHSLFRQQERFDFYRREEANGVSVIYPHYGAAPIYVQCSDGEFHPGTVWYKNILYTKETYRGLDDQEDACSIGEHHLILEPGQKTQIVFSTDADQMMSSWDEVYKSEVARLQSIKKERGGSDVTGLDKEYIQFYKDLLVAGDQFLVKRDSSGGQSIIAGYHWFTDWGRDTMIAMRGLVIATGQKETAKNIISTFLSYLRGGLIPNRFPDQGEQPEYNTIDASLWLFIVLHEYHNKFKDDAFIRDCLPRLEEIVSAYTDGTHYGIHMNEEGLIFGGEGLSQLTWMDAKVGDYVVTPRHGCPVEINALWYNALRIFSWFQMQNGIEDPHWIRMADKVKTAFRTWFINKNGYLNDVVIPGAYVDDAFRPNQIYALSLPFSLLTEHEGEQLLNCITETLLTPYGLRSLCMDHPDFHPVYGGDQWHRDTAYHQGTVWSFLMGEYLLAYLKVHRYSNKTKQHVIACLRGLKDHFYHSDAIHGISEIFDGAMPGSGRGCIHQAWSVGMVLRVFEALKEGAEMPSRPSGKKAAKTGMS